MLHKRLISALQKIGAKVTELNRGFKDPYSKWFQATLNGEAIDWYTSQNFNIKLNDYDDQLFVSYVSKRSPDTDSQTDCFCDSYAETIRRSLYLLQRHGY